MSEFNPQSQGQKTASVSAMIREAGGNLPVPSVNGDSFATTSPRAPTTRQTEGREVTRVPKQPVDLTKIDPASLAESDLSGIALGIAGKQPAQMPQEVIDRVIQIRAAVADIQARYDAVPWEEVAKIDAGRAVMGQQELAMELQSLKQARMWADQVDADYNQMARYNDMLMTAHQMLERFPWLSSRKAVEAARAWARKRYNMTNEQIAQASDEDFAIACAEYEAYMAGRNKRLDVNVGSHVMGEAISAKAKQLAKKGKLSPAMQAQLVSQLLSSAAK